MVVTVMGQSTDTERLGDRKCSQQLVTGRE